MLIASNSSVSLILNMEYECSIYYFLVFIPTMRHSLINYFSKLSRFPNKRHIILFKGTFLSAYMGFLYLLFTLHNATWPSKEVCQISR